MYYPELLEIIKKTGAKDAIEKLDKYFAFIPNRSEKTITISDIASMLELDYSIVDVIFKAIDDLEIVGKVFLVICPECGREILVLNRDEVIEKIKAYNYCYKCKKEIEITSSDVIVAYKVLKNPNLDSLDLTIETQHLLNDERLNYTNEEVLKNLFDQNKENPHDFFYKPSNDVLQQMKNIYDNLDSEFKNTKQQGDSLEGLVKLLFSACAGMRASTDIKTPTNQIDCTVRNDYFIPLTVYKELGSIVKAEAKNEPLSVPGNGYYHKLHGIISLSKSKTEQAVGILFSRLAAASTCYDLARQYFLSENIIIINFDDNDLHSIIYDKVNFLDLLQEKIQQVKSNIKVKPDKHMLYREKKKDTDNKEKST